MGRVRSLTEARVARTQASLTPALLRAFERGDALVVRVDEIGDPEEWRRSARRAAHEAGYRIRTGVTRDGSAVWAANP
jgi:nicotinic acid phosphoribosyltransferase